MPILPDLQHEMYRLITEAQKQDIFLRVLGGLAIKIHSPNAGHRSLERSYPDIDFVTDKQSAKTFNTLSGDRRQLYYDEEHGRQIDVFIGDFSMCHKLPLADRLEVEPVTLPLAELYLSKAQIVTLNRKDVLDLLALILDHKAGPGDEETINTDLIAGLCARDWGLYTTVSLNNQKLAEFVDNGEVELDETQKQTIKDRLAAIQQAMDAAPKTRGWKLRARVGTRMRWYEEVEEVQRT
jgi:hypothetical protein